MSLSDIFHDIEPILQDDGPHPVCAIDYPDRFVEAMNYLRALIDIDEHSERALELTGRCLRYNPANYTTWWYRRQCLSVLSKQDEENGDDNNDTATTNDNNNNNNNDEKNSSATYYNAARIQNDLELAQQLGGSNPKNYQVWYHRRSLLEVSFQTLKKQLEVNNNGDDNDDDGDGDGDGKEEMNINMNIAKDELKYIATVLEEDSKNYHAWSHRQWILKTINDATLWSNDIEYSSELIEKDVRNNSAWNQRWFTTHRGGSGNDNGPMMMTMEDAKLEAEYAIKISAIDPYNESPLRYLIALLREQQKQQQQQQQQKQECIAKEEEEKLKEEGNIEEMDDIQFVSFLNNVETKIDGLKNTLNNENDCPALISAYIDILEMKNDSISLEKGALMANDLGLKYDVIRKKYWLMREGKLRLRCENE